MINGEDCFTPGGMCKDKGSRKSKVQGSDPLMGESRTRANAFSVIIGVWGYFFFVRFLEEYSSSRLSGIEKTIGYGDTHF